MGMVAAIDRLDPKMETTELGDDTHLTWRQKGGEMDLFMGLPG